MAHTKSFVKKCNNKNAILSTLHYKPMAYFTFVVFWEFRKTNSSKVIKEVLAM